MGILFTILIGVVLATAVAAKSFRTWRRSHDPAPAPGNTPHPKRPKRKRRRR